MANNINIDGKEYPLELLSEEAKAQLLSIQMVDRKITEAQQDLAIMQTARNTYAKALKELLPGDSLSFD